MKRKVLTSLLAGAMALSLLAGCSSGDNNPGGGNTSNPGGGGGSNGEVTDVTLKIWVPSNQIDTGILAEQQAAFQAEHPEWNLSWDVTAVGEDTCKDEILRDVDAVVRMLIIDLLSLNIMPFLIYPVIENVFSDLADDRAAFFEARKAEAIETIMRRIKKHQTI